MNDLSGSRPLDRVLARLDGVKRSSNGYTAKCPAHDDKNPSLSIDEGDDGRVLLKCFAGCSLDDILEAINLSKKDLFPEGNGGNRRERARAIPPDAAATAQPQPGGGCTLAQYAEAKGLPIEFLRTLGLKDIKYYGRNAVRIPYLDEAGADITVRFRLALTKSKDSDDRFRWKSGAKPCPYGLWLLKRAREDGHVTLVEGESDAQTLWYHGIPALGIPGAATWKEEWAEYLDGIPIINVVLEPDKGGDAVCRWLERSRIRDPVQLVTLGNAKDPSELYLADRQGFRDAWQEALKKAVSWRDYLQAEAETKKRAAWRKCSELAGQPRILELVAEELSRHGVAGEKRTVKLLYLVINSRLLARPVSGAVKGPSSSGKSYLVERVLDFFPSQASYALSAMSERALAYSQEPLAHRMLVIFEAVGLQGDFASYLVRSLLSEGRVRYETVEKTREGLRARLIEREGPTGLLVTTTAFRLHPENETRLLSVPVTDTAEQTQQIMAQLGDESVDDIDADFSSWHALQEWLELAERRVVIPYARVLAEAVPPVAIRLRRDFGMLLNLIRSHAVLQQATRARDDAGRIVATLDDYEVVRGLVHDLVAEGAEATVSATIRQTVAAVSQLLSEGAEEVTVAALAQQLKLDKATALRRARAALDRHYLSNREDRKGRPARLVLGEPLPEGQELLPTVEALKWRLMDGGCRVAGELGGITHSLSPEPPPEQPEDGGIPDVEAFYP